MPRLGPDPTSVGIFLDDDGTPFTTGGATRHAQYKTPLPQLPLIALSALLGGLAYNYTLPAPERASEPFVFQAWFFFAIYLLHGLVVTSVMPKVLAYPVFAYFAVSGLLEHLPEVVPAIAVFAPATRPVAAVVFVLFFGMCFYHFHRSTVIPTMVASFVLFYKYHHRDEATFGVPFEDPMKQFEAMKDPTFRWNHLIWYHLFHLAMHQVMVVAPPKYAINKHWPDYRTMTKAQAAEAAKEAAKREVEAKKAGYASYAEMRKAKQEKEEKEEAAKKEAKAKSDEAGPSTPAGGDMFTTQGAPEAPESTSKSKKSKSPSKKKNE